jgi:hypothetical protein
MAALAVVTQRRLCGSKRHWQHNLHAEHRATVTYIKYCIIQSDGPLFNFTRVTMATIRLLAHFEYLTYQTSARAES